jgi:hypothetical protein
MRTSELCLGTVALVSVVEVGSASAAPLSNDLFEAASITSASGTIGESNNGLFGGTGFGGQEEGNTIFSDTTAPAVIGADPY